GCESNLRAFNLLREILRTAALRISFAFPRACGSRAAQRSALEKIFYRQGYQKKVVRIYIYRSRRCLFLPVSKKWGPQRVTGINEPAGAIPPCVNAIGGCSWLASAEPFRRFP